MKILLAEDDFLLSEGLSQSLRQAGYAVDCMLKGSDTVMRVSFPPHHRQMED